MAISSSFNSNFISKSASVSSVARLEDSFEALRAQGLLIISCNIYPADRDQGENGKAFSLNVGEGSKGKPLSYLTTEHGTFRWSRGSNTKAPNAFYKGLLTPFHVWNGSTWVEPTAIVKQQGAAIAAPTSKASGLPGAYFMAAKKCLQVLSANAEASGDVEEWELAEDTLAKLNLSLVCNLDVSFDVPGVDERDLDGMRRDLMDGTRPSRAVFAVRFSLPESAEDFNISLKVVEVLSWNELPLALPEAGRLQVTTEVFNNLQAIADEEYNSKIDANTQLVTMGRGAAAMVSRGGTNRTVKRNEQRAAAVALRLAGTRPAVAESEVTPAATLEDELGNFEAL